MDAQTLVKQAFKEFTPPKRQKISEWAKEHFELPETSAEPGKWNKDRAAYQSGILDAVCEPGVQKVTLMCSAQIGKTIILLIISTLNDFKVLLQNNIYGTTEAVDKYVQIVNEVDERWLGWLSRDYRATAEERNKILFLCWINESSPVYNSGNVAELTETYSIDLQQFISTDPQRGKFKAIIYSVIYNHSAFVTFQNHLTSAYLGTNGYNPALKNYNVEIRLDIPDTTTAEDYYADFLGTKIVGRIPNN